MTGVTQGYRRLSSRAVDHDQFAHQNAAVGPSYVQQQSPYSFQPHQFVMLSDHFKQAWHTFFQHHYQNIYLIPELAWLQE